MLKMKQFVSSDLGSYIVNVTRAAEVFMSAGIMGDA